MDDAYTQKRLNKIQFLQDTSNDERFTYKTKEILARKSYVTIDTSARIPGGPSFGAGAYDNVKATKGGGGVIWVVINLEKTPTVSIKTTPKKE